MWLAVRAVRLGMDWRPVLGLTEADRGSLVEQVLAQTIALAAHIEHEEEEEARLRALGPLAGLL